MKKLTQDIFKDAPDWVKSAIITRRDKGSVFGINMTIKEFREWRRNGSVLENIDFVLLGVGYQAYFWQKGEIDREVGA